MIVKKYLKKVSGSAEVVHTTNLPTFGKVPDMYRNQEWNINGVWHTNRGGDVTESTDPFGDGSLMHKWMFNGNLKDEVTGVVGTNDGVPNTSYIPGKFGNLALHCPNTGPGTITGPITLGDVALPTSKVRTISSWVNFHTSHEAHHALAWALRNTDHRDGPRVASLYYNYQYIATYTDSLETQTYLRVQVAGGNGIKLPGRKDVLDITDEPHHFLTVLSDSTITTYLDGVYVGTASSVLPGVKTLHNLPGTMTLSHPYWRNGYDIQQLEVYDRELSPEEIKVLYNQQFLSPVKHDGVEVSSGIFNPPSFTYLEENGKLIELDVNEDGYAVDKRLVDKPGYVDDSTNILIPDDEHRVTDRYGKPMLGGMINRVIQNTSYTRGTSNAVGEWADFNTFDLEMDTNKFDYVICLNTRAFSSGSGGTDINIQANGNTLVTTGHVSHGVPNTYIPVTVHTPKVTEGYVGTVRLVGALSLYDGTGESHNHDNGGMHSGRDSSDNKSDFIVYEIYKETT